MSPVWGKGVPLLAKDANTFDFYNGTFQETFNATVTSNGTTITMSLEQSGGGDLTMRFSDGYSILDCTPAQTTTLTAGSDVSPTENYVYVLQSTKALTVSTSDWPSAEHIKVAYFLVPTAAFVQTNGVYINQNWNDHLQGTDNMGHMAHMAERSRRLGAIYNSGIDGNGTTSYVTITTNVGTPDNVTVQSTAGILYQMHVHSYPAKDTSSGDTILVVNDSSTAYDDITDLNSLLTDADGDSMSGRFFNLVLWGVANKSGEFGPLMINLPTGSYANQSDATGDVNGEDVFTIPAAFNRESSTGFLIARITLRHQAASGGTWSHIQTIDLRGLTPAVAAGSSAGTAVTEFADNSFKIFDEGDVSKIMQFQVSGLTTSTTRTYTVLDTDGNMALNDAAMIQGSIPFVDSSGRFTQDNTRLFWDDTNNRLGLGTSSPTYWFDLVPTATDTTAFHLDGEANPYTGTSNNVLAEIARTINTASGNDTFLSKAMDVELNNTHILSGTIPDATVSNIGIDVAVTKNANNSVDFQDGGENNFALALDVTCSGSVTGTKMTTTNSAVNGNVNATNAYNNAGGTYTETNYGGKFSISNSGTVTAGTVTRNNYGVHSRVTGNTGGTTTNYGFYVDLVSGADTNWAFYDNSGANSYFKGAVGLNDTTIGAQLHITPASTSTIGQIIEMNVSQTADAFQVTDNAGVVRFKVDFDGGLVANESSLDVDSRIEGAALENLFYCDAGNDRVGINTSTPEGLFTVQGNASANNLFYFEDGASVFRVHWEGNTWAVIHNYSTGHNVYWGETTDTGGFYFRGKTMYIEGPVIINDANDSAHDVTMESALYTKMFFLDSSADRIGINNGSPADLLHILGEKIGGSTTPSAGCLMLSDSTAIATGVGGVLIFRGKYTSGGLETTAAGIHAYKDNATSGQFGFGLAFNTRLNGGSHNLNMYLSSVGELQIGRTLTDPDAMLEVESSTTYGKQLVTLDQNDTDQPFIDFVGSAAGNTSNSLSTLTTSGATTHHIQIEINGTKAWIAASTNNPS